MGRAFFPLDEELALLPGNLAPRQHEHLVHLATWMPFACATQMLERLLQVQVGQETVRRLTEQAGAALEAQETEQAQAGWQEEPARKQQEARLALSADGAMVPLIKGEWAEARTLAIGVVAAQSSPQDGDERRVEHLSYFSRVTSAERFTELAEVEMRRRRVLQAEAVCALGDGADWLQTFFDVHRPDAVRILDFPHAAEHLNAVLSAIGEAGSEVPAGTLSRCLHVLKHRGPHTLLRLSTRLPQEVAQQDGIREHLGYFKKREVMMHYPQFRQQGWPIGSGMVESANKLVVEARLKGAGMRWQRNNVNALLALRNAVCNERWSPMWSVAMEQAHQQQVASRTARAKLGQQAALALHNPLLLESPPLPPQPAPQPPPASASSSPSAPAATLPGSSRPSKHHPWKHIPACASVKRFAKI